ncbi:hypothetical protein IJ674_06310 [bacterium]|nr:hypothetical protein [bacterium]
MKRIIFTGDFLRNSEKYNKRYFFWVFKILSPIIKSAISPDIKILYDIKNDAGEKFSREYFYELAGETEIKECYHKCNFDAFTQEQIEYLKKFLDENTIIIGSEMYTPLCDLLTSLGCKVFDFAFHSYKLFDDLAFAIYTNDISAYEQMQKYKIPQNKFYYYANYWKVFMEYNNMIPDDKLQDNSALFIGQTLTDKSVEKDGVFLNIEHFENEIKELSKQYSKIYYIPHPYLYKNSKAHMNYVKKNPNIELLNDVSTYSVLASDKIKKVMGISTSMLYEARYFNKDVQYFFQPLFNIDAPFEQHSYTSIFEDYWNPKFWADVLSPICDINSDVEDANYFKGASNKMRNIRDLYWGYASFDPIKRIPNFQEAIKRLYVRYIARKF